MIKLLMTWDIKPGRESTYLEFVSQHFTPRLIKLGLDLSEVWYTHWGPGPHITVGFIAEDQSKMKEILNHPDWQKLTTKLQDHVLNFKFKLLPASGTFQI